MTKKLTLLYVAAAITLGSTSAAALASRVDGGIPADACTRVTELCYWINY